MSNRRRANAAMHAAVAEMQACLDHAVRLDPSKRRRRQLESVGISALNQIHKAMDRIDLFFNVCEHGNIGARRNPSYPPSTVVPFRPKRKTPR